MNDQNLKINIGVNADLAGAKQAEDAVKQVAQTSAKANSTPQSAQAAQSSQAAIDKQVQSLKQLADVQKLVNAGKEREAYILQQVQSASRNSASPLSRAQVVDVRSAAGKAYDIRAEGVSKSSSDKAQSDAAAKARLEVEARLKAEEAVRARGEEQLRTLKQQADVQNLLNKGKEKEAYILTQVQAAQRNSSGPLSRSQILSVRSAAGSLYDSRTTGRSISGPSQSDSARRVVESIGGEAGEAGGKLLNLQSRFAALGSAIGSFGGIAGLAIVAIGGIGVAAAKALEFVKTLVEKTIESATEIRSGAKAMEMSYDAYQKFREAAEQAGASQQELLLAVRTSSNKIADAQKNPEGDSTRQLGKLGFSTEDFNGKDAAQQFEMIAAAIRDIPDLNAKRSMIGDFFGRSALQLTDLINQFDRYKEDANSVARINDKTIESAHQLSLAFNDLGQALTALTANTGIISWLANLSSNIAGLATAFHDFSKSDGGKMLLSGLGTAVKTALIGSNPLLNAGVYAVEAAGSKDYFAKSPEEKAKKSSEDAAKVKADEDARKATADENKRKARDMDADKMIRSYQERGAMESAYTGEDKRALEVKQQVEGYNRAHGAEQQISPEKADQIDQASKLAFAASGETDLKRLAEGFDDEARSASAVNDQLKAQDDLRRKLREYEKAHGKLTPDETIDIASKAQDALNAKNRASLQERMQGIDQQLKQQRMLNDGLGKEAYVDQQIYDVEKQRGSKLSDQERTDFASKAGALYDLQQPSRQVAEAKQYTSLEAIGGGYSSMRGSASENPVGEIKKSNEFLSKLYEGVGTLQEAVTKLSSLGSGRKAR